MKNSGKKPNKMWRHNSNIENDRESIKKTKKLCIIACRSQRNIKTLLF